MTQERTAETADAAPLKAAFPASLEHLTGAQQGSVSWLGADLLDVSLSTANTVQLSDAAAAPPAGEPLAQLRRVDGGFELTAAKPNTIWINGRAVRQAPLANGDIIEFGETGPLSRFHLHRDGRGKKRAAAVILRDCRDYLRASRQPLHRRSARASATLARRLTRETTVLFRISVVCAIALLVGFALHQYRQNARLAEALQSSEARVEQIAAALARARREALQAGDLQALREELAARLGTQQGRLAALEKRSGAIARVISGSVASVAFVQGAFGYRDKQSGRVLRRVVGPAGEPLITPFGQPVLSLEGDGPPVEIQYTSTGFAIAGTPVLVTNRHVAYPWEDAPSALGGKLEPVMTRFQAYFPQRPEPLAVELLKASDTADLALLRVLDPSGMKGIGLHLSETPPKQGDDIIVLGYPTGLRSLLAQSGEAFIEKLQAAAETDFWAVSKQLAAAGFIQPLASRGIVGQATPAAVVYDAETTHGGSGGPVLDMNGRIVAVNSAILPEYGGSNFGVPAALLRTLLQQAGYP